MAEDYDTLYTKIARDVILQAAGEYAAPRYWKDRTQVGIEMQ